MPRKSSVVPSLSKGEKSCCFCGLTDNNELDYGKIHEYKGIVTHYYCLLFSSNMQQQGLDDEGILGFLPGDIHKELKRGKRLVCSYCKKSGATLGCCNTRCKKIFHYPCGLKAGSLHQFFGEFRSYCIHHRPKQIIEERISEELLQCENKICYICYEEVNLKDNLGTIWAPCCKKNAFFHRTCVQQLAISAGYFFKCPLCNNKPEFQRAMLDHGIFIPSQDASWELVPNAFQELLYRHNRCDAEKCGCPKGREYTSTNAKWELTLCRTCGSQGIHMACGNLKWGEPVWECTECTSILNKSMTNTESPGLSNGSSSHRESRVENNASDDENSSDSEISVGAYPETPTAILNPTVQLQSVSFFPKATNIEEKSPKKQRRDDIGNPISSKSPRKVIEDREARDDRRNNEELAPLTKKPKISLEPEVNKDESDDDVIVVSGPSRKELHRALDIARVLRDSGKTAKIGHDAKQRPDEPESPLKSNNLVQAVLNSEGKVLTSSTGLSTSPQVQSPMSRIEKPVPIEIDLSDSETTPTTNPSTVVNPKTSTNAKPSVPELNIQITNVTSLAPEAFATVPESHDRPIDAEKPEPISVTEKPKNVTATPVYQRLEIVRFEAQPAADNLEKPVIYGLTIPGTNTTVPLIITTAETPKSSPAPLSDNNPPIPPSLSKLAGPKSRKAAILAAAASKNSAIRSNAASAPEAPKLLTPTLRNNDISASASPKSTPPTIQSNGRSNVATVNLAASTLQNNDKPTTVPPKSTVKPDFYINNRSSMLTPRKTALTVQNHEKLIVMAPQSTLPTIQVNERSPTMTQRVTVPSMRNKDGSIVTFPHLPVLPDRCLNAKSPLANLAPKITVSAIPISEDSAVLSPISTAPQNQSNQIQMLAVPNSTMPTSQNNQRSNIVTVTIGRNDEPTVGASKLPGSTRSNDRWLDLASEPTTPTIQSNEKSTTLTGDPSTLSTSKLSYSLPLEAVVNDQILQSRAGKKFDTKRNRPYEKTPLKKNTSTKTTSVRKNQDTTNGITSAPTPESPTASSKHISQNPRNGFVSSRKIALLTPKSPSSSSPNVSSINSESFAAPKVFYPAIPVGDTCKVQNRPSPEISAEDNLNQVPLSNGIQQGFDTSRKNFNSGDSIRTGNRTTSESRNIPTTPHLKDSHAEDKKSPDSPENCDGDAGTSPDVRPKCAVPTNIKSNATMEWNTHQNVDGTEIGNDVSKKCRTKKTFRNDSQYDAEKNETTERSTAANRGDSADRIGLINRMINLRDLKFTVCGSNIVKMTLYETYCVNMKIENGRKRKFQSCKNYKGSEETSSDSLVERTHGCDILRNIDDHNGFSDSLTNSRAFGNDRNSEKGATSQSSDNLQSNAVTKVLEVLPSDLTCENGSSRGQDELKENLDPVPSSTNTGTPSPMERKSKTGLRNGGVNKMQLLNEQDAQKKIISETTKNSPRKKGNQDQSLGTLKPSYNEKREVACGVVQNSFVSNDEEGNRNSHCENIARKCKTRLTRANDDKKMSESIESSPKRPKYDKFEDLNDEVPPVNHSRIDNTTFSNVVITENVWSGKSPRVNNVCKNEKMHSNNGPKNTLKPSCERETTSDNSVCCKVSIDLAKIRTLIANKISLFEKMENNKFHKSPEKNERTKCESRFPVKKFPSFDHLVISDDRSSSIQRFSMVQTRRWKSDDNLSSCSKFEDTFARSNTFSHGEDTRRGHKRKTQSFEKHDCVR